MILQLCSLGGHTCTEVITRIMSHLLTNELSIQFNWKGRGEKRAFGLLKLSKIVKASAKRTLNVETEATIEAKIKSWLKYSKDRAGGRKARAGKQADSNRTRGSRPS